MLHIRAFFIALFVLAQGAAYAQFTFFSFGSTWKYKDDGSNQGTAWQSPSFDDSGWSSGAGQLGFGEGDETTILTSGKIGYYFRKIVNIPDVSAYQNFTVEMFRDDGVVIYINGLEVIRDNMPTGTINFNTFAFFASDDGQTKITYTLPISQFQSGVNTIAVEVHQESAGSSDVSWDMKLTGMPVTLTSLIPFAATWKYLDSGSDQGTTWKETSFSDAGWLSGAGKLGYPQNRVTTLLNACGSPVANPSCSNKYITYYFRKTVNIPSISLYQSFKFQFYRDDGIVVYVNGTEVFRNNIEAGAFDYLTLASNAADNGNLLIENSVPVTAFVDGDNTIAVEVHQASAASGDLIFDMGLIGAKVGHIEVGIGPYLQKATSSSILLRWRTNIYTDSKVWYGTASDNMALSATGANPSTTEHTVALSGLSPSTRYYYSIGTSSLILDQDEGNYFVTLPAPDDSTKYTFWVTGDAGDNSANQLNVRDSYYSYMGNKTTNGWLLLGDNAYDDGLDQEYTDYFFNIYKSNIARKAPLWPATGNHEYADNSDRQEDHDIAYFDLFDLPINAEAGGVASASEAYYSYDHGNIHFVVLDSYIIENSLYRLYDAGSPQLQWLQTDLAANTKTWTVVYFHHPPYTMGSHNSDTENELIKIRENVLPILEQYKVDLVMSGHSHNYERSRLMKGYFGFEGDFNATTYNLSQSSGKYQSNTSCAYVKDATNFGTVYVVAGSAGELDNAQASYPHDAMYYSNNSVGGSFILEVEENRLDGKWLTSAGAVLDNFTIMKNVNKVKTINLNSGESTTLRASWVGNYTWSSGETTRSINITPAAPETYTVTDSYGCITDIFNITMNPLPVKLFGFTAQVEPDQIVLNWKTATEVNNDFFEVQRFINFEEAQTLGKVLGNGTTSELHSYEFIDTSPMKGVSYYRLKQVDYDGRSEYSNVVRAEYTGSDKAQLFPNPGNGLELNLSIESDEGPLQISVLDARGSKVAVLFIAAPDRSASQVQVLKFDTPISSGLYFVQIKSNAGVTTNMWMVK